MYEVRQECERLATEAIRLAAREGSNVDLEKSRRERREELDARMARGGKPLVLPYMPGQPEDPHKDSRVGKSFAELRAAGYPEHYITGPVPEAMRPTEMKLRAKPLGTATRLSEEALKAAGFGNAVPFEHEPLDEPF